MDCKETLFFNSFVLPGDLIVPKPLECGGFLKNLQLVVMWFSSGGTKSVLHSDSIDNINCLLDGTKELRMIDKVCFSAICFFIIY